MLYTSQKNFLVELGLAQYDTSPKICGLLCPAHANIKYCLLFINEEETYTCDDPFYYYYLYKSFV
jgi:hypothetical protein